MSSSSDRQFPTCGSCGVRHIGPHCPNTFSPSKEPEKLAANEAAYQQWLKDGTGEAGKPFVHPVPKEDAPAPRNERVSAAPTPAEVLFAFLASASGGKALPTANSIAGYAAQLGEALGIETKTVETGGIVFLPDGSAFVTLDGFGTFFVIQASRL